MSQVHGWKSLSAYQRWQVERMRANSFNQSIVHVEGLGSMSEAKAEEEETNEQKGNEPRASK